MNFDIHLNVYIIYLFFHKMLWILDRKITDF